MTHSNIVCLKMIHGHHKWLLSVLIHGSLKPKAQEGDAQANKSRKDPKYKLCQAKETESRIETQKPPNKCQETSRVLDCLLNKDCVRTNESYVNDGNFCQEILTLSHRVKVISILVVEDLRNEGVGEELACVSIRCSFHAQLFTICN